MQRAYGLCRRPKLSDVGESGPGLSKPVGSKKLWLESALCALPVWEYQPKLINGCVFSCTSRALTSTQMFDYIGGHNFASNLHIHECFYHIGAHFCTKPAHPRRFLITFGARFCNKPAHPRGFLTFILPETSGQFHPKSHLYLGVTRSFSNNDSFAWEWHAFSAEIAI